MTEYKEERVELTDTEWMDLIDGDRDGLPRCCANVSALRDDIIRLARDGGIVNSLYVSMLRTHATWVFPAHGNPSPTLQKLFAQLDIPTTYEDDDHEVTHEV